MRIGQAFGCVMAAALVVQPVAAQTRADQKPFFDLYKELVETNTVVNEGSCTKAAAQVAARMKAAGYTDEQLTLFSTPEHPNDGGLVAVLKGTDPKAKPILLLAHIDVVAAKRADWTRDPFKLIEENGYYYGRGTVDDKAMAATWADTMIRLRAKPPKRTLKMALTCGEETTYAFNGAEWLSKNRRDLIDAEYALNEGGGGRLDANGKRELLAMQVGEKAAQNFTLVATNPGGHSSQPTPDNAIYELADAIEAIRAYEFPVKFTDTTRVQLNAVAASPAAPPALKAAIKTLLANPGDAAADKIVSMDKTLHSTLRTTCVATLLNAGHAENALPQRATANVNCRIFPGETVEQTTAKLQELAGPKVKVTANQPVRPLAIPPKLDPRIMGPATKVAAKHFPGVPLVPIMLTGATDAVFTGGAGIPTYGVPGTFIDKDMSGVHGLNERIAVASLYDGRDYLFDLVKVLADQ